MENNIWESTQALIWVQGHLLVEKWLPDWRPFLLISSIHYVCERWADLVITIIAWPMNKNTGAAPSLRNDESKCPVLCFQVHTGIYESFKSEEMLDSRYIVFYVRSELTN